MIPLTSLLATSLPWQFGVRALPPEPVDVVRVALAECLADIESLDRGALVVLTRATTDEASTYQLDVFVRQAVRREAAAVVLRRSTARSITAEALAMRGQVAILDVDDDVDPADVVEQVTTLVAGDARAALRRLSAAAQHDWQHEDGEAADIVAKVGTACGVVLDYEEPATEGWPVVTVDGSPIGMVRTSEPGDLPLVAARLAAEATTSVLARREQLVLRPMRTTSAALGQVLVCSQSDLSAVAARASGVGLDVHGWHCAARFSATDGADAAQSELVDREVLALVAEHVAPADGADWSVTRPDGSWVLVRTTRQPQRRDASRRVRDGVALLSALLRQTHPGLHVRIGIGTAHDGPTGLRVSAAEARTALASAELSEEAENMAQFDALGVDRMMVEWLTTDSAREAVRDLLAPLDQLGPQKSATAVATLHAILDEQGSLQRAAHRLHLHRNAVVYRLDRIRDLGFDLADPDQRFALQLVCRARLMTSGPAT